MAVSFIDGGNGVPGENNIPTKMTDKLLYHNVCLFVYDVYDVQQYFSYTVAVSFIGGGTGVPGENR